MFNAIFKTGRKKHVKKTCVIGVLGLSRGVGTTHFTYILTGFLKAYYGESTLFVEVCRNGSLHRMFDVENTNQSIVRHGIAYHLGAGLEEVSQIRNVGYSFCILDFGSDYGYAKEHFMNCDIKITVGVSAVWQQQMWASAKEIIKDVKDCSTFCFIVNFGDISDKIKSSLLPAETYQMPYEPDFMRISENTVKLFRKIIKEYS